MSKKYVIDSNIFAKIFLEEEDTLLAKEFIENTIKERAILLVPSIFSYEVIYIAQKNRGLNPRQVSIYLAKQRNINIINLSPEITDEALKIIEKTTHEKSGFPSFYDSSYHAIAILNGCDFITADKKHYTKTKKIGNIKLLSDVNSLRN